MCEHHLLDLGLAVRPMPISIRIRDMESLMKSLVAITFIALLTQGCATAGHEAFYSQMAPAKYPPTERVMVFQYSNVDLNKTYDLLFSDFLVIGRSGFNGPYEDPFESVSFAKSIGTDVFLSATQFKETKTSFMNLSTPTSSTTYISGYSGAGSLYGTATTYGTHTTTVPISIDRYDQHGLYLRNVNSVIPLWERTESQYKRTEPSDIEGIWFNEHYKLHLYRSGQQYVAFISGEPKEREAWKPGELKLVYGVDSGVGIYLMGDKTPMPAQFKLNKFGHLEVALITAKETFSFAR
jgi:hypothetical protein